MNHGNVDQRHVLILLLEFFFAVLKDTIGQMEEPNCDSFEHLLIFLLCLAFSEASVRQTKIVQNDGRVKICVNVVTAAAELVLAQLFHSHGANEQMESVKESVVIKMEFNVVFWFQ